jgi:hypothetical protein
MNAIHQIIIESVSGGFWKFIGYWLLIITILGIPSELISKCVSIISKRRKQ